MQVRTRFAPSPTGYLHVGGMRTALYAFMYAKKVGGKFILRIEDTDKAREVKGAIEVIINNLRDAGIIYDEGPDNGGPFKPYIQSQRKNIYLKYAKELVERGGAYYCFCGEERLESLKEKGFTKYDKHCLSLSKEEVEQKLKQGAPCVIRQNVPLAGATVFHDEVFGDIRVENSELEDGVLIKSDGMPTYNFANVIDDHLMEITAVLRGTEFLSSTPKYNLIYDAFGWQRPLYVHMPPIMKDAQHKLSKRDGAASYDDFKAKGYLKEAIINYIALLGWSPKSNTEKMTLSEMTQLFSVEGISRSSSIFDENKLKWLNGLYIKELPFETFVKLATPWLDKSKVGGKYDYEKLCKLIQGRTEVFSEIADKVKFLEEFTKYDLALFENKKQKSDLALAKKVLPLVLGALKDISLTNWSNEKIYQSLCSLAQKEELKNSQIFWVSRIALTGKESTPGGATEIAELLGKEESIKRIGFSTDLINVN